jgi:hypothetical protein
MVLSKDKTMPDEERARQDTTDVARKIRQEYQARKMIIRY